MHAKRVLTGCLFLLMIAYGLSITMIGPLMPILIRRYSLRLSGGGLVFSFHSIGGLLIIFVAGVLIDRLPKLKLIGLLFLLYSVWLLAIGTAPVYSVLLLLFFALGAATRMLDITLNAYIADLYPERRAFYLNLLHAFFGIGAFLGPILTQSLLDAGLGWHHVFLAFGGLCVPILATYVTVARGREDSSKHASLEKGNHTLSWLRNPRILVLSLIMILYAGHQTSVTVWLPTYLQRHIGTDARTASYALSVFWLGIIIGRSVTSVLAARLDPRHLLFGGCLIGGILLVMGIMSELSIALIFAVGIAGLLTGATIPLIIALGCGWFPSHSGSVTSLLYLNSNLAKMIFPWLVGAIADAYDFKLGMLVAGITLVLASLLTLPLLRINQRCT